eukprot:CAMPEP_0174859344 /NCGR_PEP_ID=MMETSP1114-20130205/46141_1 /TAXON_ID=312471 /ORGANISM="Neobodo designis, Strain CCAP 1951/1" /LENGTH=55 /DNA_ID=CAMNT_0016094293 /DNA_START=24 /DNA_END=187 /DNA_ORIENTATION=+
MAASAILPKSLATNLTCARRNEESRARRSRTAETSESPQPLRSTATRALAERSPP